MKISMWMLYDALSEECARHNLDDRSKKICLKGVLPYRGTDNLTDGYLYVIDATEAETVLLPSVPCCLVIAGEKFEEKKVGVCQYIVLNVRYIDALFAALKAFEKYTAWYDALQDELNGAQDLNKLCRLGSEILGNNTMLYDREYTVIAGSFDINNELSDTLVETSGPFYALSSDAVRQLKSNAAFQQTFRQTGAAVCIVDFLPYAVLYVNLGKGDTYEGRLCIHDTLRPFKNGDYQIAEILTDFLRLAIKRQAIRSNDESRKFEAFLLRMLEGYMPEVGQLASALTLWHWKRFGRYLCVFAQLNDQDAETSSDYYLISRISLLLPGSCTVRDKNGIACVVSLTEKDTAAGVVDKLERLIRGFIPHIGVSNVYNDFLETGQFYKQAVIAAEMGEKDEPDNWRHFFRDYVMAHYFKCGTSVLPAIHFCDEDVRRLMTQGTTGASYYNTLKVYLENNMNLLETSKALYVHRTTLFKRISKIKALISADLNNPEDRTRMLMSFKLMEADKKYGRS